MSKKNYVSLEKSQRSKQNEIPVKDNVSLVERMKPMNFTSYMGQKHVIGPNTILRSFLEIGEIPSMILWGPPGCGKKSLVNIIIQLTKEKFQDKTHIVKLAATTCGIGEVKTAVEKAKSSLKFGHRTIVFMDNIHRFNKLQQDIFLPHVEAGTFILIGATIENPSYSLNSALLSRCRIFSLSKLSPKDIIEILKKSIHSMDGRIHNSQNSDNASKFIIHSDTLEWLAEVCDGDARTALSGLEFAICAKNLSYDKTSVISLEDIKQGLISMYMEANNKNEQTYHLYSALHKSICAGKPNASLYWLARIMAAKEDPVDIARRLIRISGEDIGLADPDALDLAVHTLNACQMIGMPESDVLLAQCVIYLTKAPKSRLIYNALKAAQKVINDTKEQPQPYIP
ncbi:ATPase WRNIP1-like [Vespa mandarinia]|uniref:ATPase WRNIP1-like n=1 Tax=Vespa mandarinia TaxID=7446 RepID=UPI001608937B|nr:ATPase WRNIP1-like [Vespa mandarinia]